MESTIQTVATWWMWAGFLLFIFLMLAVDMVLLGGKRAHTVSTKEAGGWVIVWISLALLFNFLLWRYLYHTQGIEIAEQKALEFLTGYLLEESLSVDNMFVFVMIFRYFAIPPEYQRRVLLFGVLSAIALRFIMIILGVWLVSKVHWVLYLFGIFLIFTGVKMLLFADDEPKLENNPILIWLTKHMRTTTQLYKEKFFIRQNKILYATPLFIVLIFIEISDVIFAVDSISAIFAVVSDPFIIFTSNIFAILGLRALYFLLAIMTDKFHLLKYGLSVILVFIGSKLLIAYWYKISIFISLGIIGSILLISVLLSLAIKKK